jgi:glycosyltransferase involved in cell wall biosynthesis
MPASIPSSTDQGQIAYLLPDPGIPVGGTKGASVHVDALCGAMARSGASVTLYAAKVVGPLSSRGSDRVEVVPIDVGPVRSGEDADRTRVRACRRYFDQVGDLLNRRRPDWVHERLSLFAGAGTALAAGLGLPRIVEVNAPVADERRRHFSLSLVEEAARAERAALRSARVVAVSEPLVAWSLASGAASAVMVPNGADTGGLDRSQWQRHGSELRAGLGFAESQLILGFAGSLKPWHGVEVLVDAVREASRGADVGLLIVGDGPRRAAVEEAVRTLPTNVRVAVTGSVPAYDIPRYLAAMDVAVAPYLPNPHFYFSPLKVAEAMAASLPVVASDFPPVRDLLGETGLLVPAGNVEALARCLWRMAVEPDTRARMAQEGRARAIASLDWLAVARRTIDVATGAAASAVERHEVRA